LAKAGRISPPTLSRKGEDIAADQLPVFAELLVVLARDLDRAQRRIEYLTWVIAVLTTALVVDTLARLFMGH
jgi:hypothetical protein